MTRRRFVPACFAILVVGTAHAKPESAMTPAEREGAAKAVHTCSVAIRVSLHDPGSAEFPGLSRSYRALERDAYVAQVEVRARNGFNALRLSTFECRIDAKTGEFRSIRQISR